MATRVFRDEELRYAAHAKCLCGAGMAYPPDAEPEEGPFKHWSYWDCSAILKGEAIPSGEPGAVKHEDKLPFAFYEIKSEEQPSANGATTRPPGAPKYQPPDRPAPFTPVKCPFCGGSDFDLVGLKIHYTHGHCTVYEETTTNANP